MSGNQKQTAGGGPQNQRYGGTQIYQTLPNSQRPDGFHVPTPPYVPPQQQNQPSQTQGLRGIPQTPAQSSTPPTDLKVQSVPQQSMSHMYVTQQQQVRGTQGNYFRPTGPPNQTPRMSNQHRGGQQIYQTQAQYLPMPVPTPHQMFVPTNVTYYNGQRPPTIIQQPFMYGQNIPQQFAAYPSNPSQAATVPFTYYNAMPQRAGHPPQSTPVPPAATQPIPNIQLATPTTQQAPFQRQPNNKRRAKAIPIIDPDTGVDKLDEVFEQQNSSHPPSGESSARQTPQPAPHNTNKEVQAAFAKQVAQAINSDESSVEEHELHPAAVDHHIETVFHPSQPPAPPSTTRLDHLVQSSTLKVQAKEFVSISSNTAKETTPIVSAISDAVEVTLPKKEVKDRESPAKNRKQREQQQHKEAVVKDVGNSSSDKESSIKIDNKQSKETVVPATAAPTVVVTPNKDSKEIVAQQRCEDNKNKNQNQKKDSKVDATAIKVPNVETSESATQPAQSAQDSSAAAKSKNASQRNKDTQKQHQQPPPPPPVSQKQPAVAPVPQPQPAKPSSKSSKKTDLNLKGANKEGTDMDAFNDNIAELDAVNANVNSNEINANNVVVVDTPATNDANKNKTVVPTEVPAKLATKTLPKKPVDVTAIVRDKPNPPMKPFPAAVETLDETDRVAVSTEKLVQVKNDFNATKSGTAENGGVALIENKSDLPYKEDQWAPHNLDGKKVYDKDFLLALKNHPASRRKPDNIPDYIIADERGRVSDGRYSMGGRTDFTTPPFANYGGKSSSQRGAPPKRPSQSGKSGGNGKGSKPGVIKLSISVREEVKLHEVENAWKPARFKKTEEMTDDDKKTEDLYKKVRGVLNKLTPQKFETLVSQVRELQIDTAERLQGVIDLVFEKAVDEPNFSVAYALMCRELALMQVPASNSTEEKKEVVNFRKLLVTRCQIEFEKQSYDESVRLEKVKEADACPDAEKKKELHFELQEHDRKIRMKSVGNIRFIGELFKQNMLTVNIMIRCLDNLLENKDEEGLECLCKLLTTVGKELEQKKVDLTRIFNVMKEIVDKKHGEINSRVRFMLQDVLDLRKCKWVPRRQDLNPKTIDQIQKEAENEHMIIQSMNSVPITPRREDRGNSAGPKSDRKPRNISDDGWQTASRGSRTPFTVQSDKLKNKVPLTDEPLGNRQLFGVWSKGSNMKSDTAAPNTANMYAALEHMDSEKRSTGSRPTSKDAYSSKGPSLERSTYKQQSYDGRGSRSGSQHMERESSIPSQKAVISVPTPNVSKAVAPPAPVHITNEEKLERHVKNNLDEYLNDSCTIDEYSQDTHTYVPPSYYPRVVADGYLHVLERSMTARVRTGKLFAALIKSDVLPLEDYCAGLEEILSQADDLRIDIPMIWEYLAEILVHLITDEALSLSRLHKSCNVIIEQGHGSKLLASLFRLIISERGPNFLSHIWRESGLTFGNFMDDSQADVFAKDNKLEFKDGGDVAVRQSQLSYEQIHTKISDFIISKASFDDVVTWISANVGEQVTENKFIRTLATAIFQHSISKQKYVQENLQAQYKLLQKYVDNNSTYELQCLYALQALIHKLEHPKGVLLAICDRLYEDGVISQDSFIAWESCKDPAEQEGKGVALKQLTSFFTQLKENEEEDSGTSSDEA